MMNKNQEKDSKWQIVKDLTLTSNNKFNINDIIFRYLFMKAKIIFGELRKLAFINNNKTSDYISYV